MKAIYLFAILALVAAPAVADDVICADTSTLPPLTVEDGRIPFAQASFGSTKPDTDEGWANVSDVLEVPEGHRAVVEHVSIKAVVPANSSVHTFRLGTPSFGYGNVRQTFIVPTYTGQNSQGRSVFIGSQMTRIDLEAGDTLLATALRNNGIVGDFQVEVYVSGYLVAVD